MSRDSLYLERMAVLAAMLAAATACQTLAGIEDTTLSDTDGGPGGPDAGGDTTFRVRGIAGGLDEPVSLRIGYSGFFELLTVSQDGPFEFPYDLPQGTAFMVNVEGNHPCAIDRAAGTIAGADAEIGLACNGAATLDGIDLLSPSATELRLMPDDLQYEAEVSLLQQRISIATMAGPGTVVRVAGMQVNNGMPSPPVPLGPGDNEIEIVAEHTASGLQRTYRVTVRRVAAIGQFAYGKAVNTESGDGFGLSMVVDDSTLVVGAPNEDSAALGVNGDPSSNSALNSGAAYVFRRSPSGWEVDGYLKASNTGAGDAFGFSVAVSGDYLAVGAPKEDSPSQSDPQGNTAEDSGAVYIYRRGGLGWVLETRIKAPVVGAGDNFGSAVSLSGETLAVGAPFEDSDARVVGGTPDNDNVQDSGAVYVFQRSNGNWVPDVFIKASNGGAGDLFGSSVSLSGNVLAVGAPREDSDARVVNGDGNNDNAQDSGAAYVFRRDGTGWRQDVYIKASNTGARDRFGQSVAVFQAPMGETLAVGAPFEDSDARMVDGDQASDQAQDSGAVYLFAQGGPTMGWRQEAYVKASNTDELDNFGQSVALSGDLLAVGAYFEDSAPASVGGDPDDDSLADSGAVFVFARGMMGWVEASFLKASNAEQSDAFGFSVALSSDALAAGAAFESSSATDVDGDESNNDAQASGAAYVFH